MHAFAGPRFFLSPSLIAGVITLALLHPAAGHAQASWCRCPGGAVFQPGLVNYKGNSDRELVTRIEVQEGDPEHNCEAAWIGFSEVYAEGTPYSFHLLRKHLKTIREDACGESPNSFVSRTKTYQFVFDDDTQSLREIDPGIETTNTQADLRAGEKSNANVWDSISSQTTVEPPKNPKPAMRSGSAPQFVRTAWVLARRNIKGHHVAMVRGVDQHEKITPLSKVQSVRAGVLGQIEASNGRTAIVRFYGGSRVEKFARKKNTFRRWYDDIGGPYVETKDDLYSPLRAYILEVPLDDLIEVNDYLDQQKTDQT
jgi:hypothetical protein